MNFFSKLLFTENFYKRLNYNRVTLYIGILLVGLKDVGLYMYADGISIFDIKTSALSMVHLVAAIGLICIFGVMDVVFYSRPVYDILKRFPPMENFTRQRHLPIIIMKIYILANMILAPFDTFITILDRNKLIPQNSEWVFGLLSLLVLISLLWYFGVITKGVNVVFGLQIPYKLLATIINLFWIFLVNYALNYLIDIIVPFVFKII
jgi:hypothetical protein